MSDMSDERKKGGGGGSSKPGVQLSVQTTPHPLDIPFQKRDSELFSLIHPFHRGVQGVGEGEREV